MSDSWDEVIKSLKEAQDLLQKASDYWQECEEQLMVARIKGLKIREEIDGRTDNQTP